MIVVPVAGFEYSSTISQSVCEIVDKTYPHFSQSSGELLSKKHYLLNSSLLCAETDSDNKFIMMRVDKLGKATKEAIGFVGCDRFNSFLNYEAGWDGGSANPLSLESVAMIEVFIANFNNFASEPSLFLSKKGNLKLGWEDSVGGAIEIEFMPKSFKYYIEHSDEEGSVRVKEISKLINKIKMVDDAATTV